MSNPPIQHSETPPAKSEGLKIDRRLLEILVCPLTKATLLFEKDAQELVSPGARLAYPIRNGIPILLPSEARTVEG